MKDSIVKSLLSYRCEGIVVNVLCDYLNDEKDSFDIIKNKIEINNPFKGDRDKEFNFIKRDDGSYSLITCEDHVPIIIDIWIKYVLEYDGKIFELNQIKYYEEGK